MSHAPTVLNMAHGNMMQNSGYIRETDGGTAQADLLVPTMHCAGCISKIERELKKTDHILSARANLSTKRVTVWFEAGSFTIETLLSRMKEIGYDASPFEALIAGPDKARARSLLISLAVAGFAAGNIMLLSVSVWDGAEMDRGTMGLFHWISALIAAVGITIAGRPFFKSALTSLKAGQVNMDVPISLAVLLSFFASFFEASRGGELVFFDAGVMLLFFLLIGRYLDERMRAAAVGAAQNLMALQAVPATVVGADGARVTLPADRVSVGAVVQVETGMRIPVDGTVKQGSSDIDMSLVTGESLPQTACVGDTVYAGTLNMSAPLLIETTGRGSDTLLGEIVRLMETAEQGRSTYVRLADRLARLYAPAVHALAAVAFLGWWGLSGDAYTGVMRAVAVLIITCPCALGLAVPVVQVVAAGLLMKAGLLLKSGDALEKLADVDTVVFDKTGTLTRGEMTLRRKPDISDHHFYLAGSLGVTSRHPLAQGLAASYKEFGARTGPYAGKLAMLDRVKDIPGRGLEAVIEGTTVRLGSREYTEADQLVPNCGPATGPELWFRYGEGLPVLFEFRDSLRPDAFETIRQLKESGKKVCLVSGDRPETVAKVAIELNIEHFRASAQPQDKIDFLEQLKARGHRVLMVGDGLNDAPALRAAHVSLSPASGADVTQNAADAVFQGSSLRAVTRLLRLARISRQRVRENFALALGYNVIAVPLAFLGYVTPMVAAIAMSASSIVVTVNALRMRPVHKGDTSGEKMR